MSDPKNIKKVIENIEKCWGTKTFTPINDKSIIKTESISSGSISLNIALGIMGYPKGRIIEIAGWEGSGKSTLTLHAIAECQKLGPAAAYIDAEHSFDKDYAEKIGVNVNGKNPLYVSQPDHGQMAFDILDKIISSNEFGIVVIDSVAALIPKSELEGEYGDSNMGVHARLMSQAMRKLTGKIHKSNCAVLFINQFRSKIGVQWGSPTTTTGGNALKFYSSIRMEVTALKQLKDNDSNAFGIHTRVKVIKNKLAAPFKKAEFDIIYGQGISKSGELIDYGVELGIINKSGSWYSYSNNKLGQGRDNIVELLNDNPELCEELETKIKNKLKY